MRFATTQGLVMLGKQVILLFAKANKMKTAMQRATRVKGGVAGDRLAAHYRLAIDENSLPGQSILNLLARCQFYLIEQLTERWAAGPVDSVDLRAGHRGQAALNQAQPTHRGHPKKAPR